MFNINKVKTPCYVVDEKKLLHNLKILDHVRKKAGCKILLAQKAFSMFSVYPLISCYLDGTTASGLYEAKLGEEEFEGEVHVYSPAYKAGEIAELCGFCDHIVFNSFRQWEK
ncbi:MAG: carboxynorspermidine decarboxylase, partial [Ruminococcus sp.]|nr:carboxynorspermidine decarboxylase [Ruminococcus sp.]